MTTLDELQMKLKEDFGSAKDKGISDGKSVAPKKPAKNGKNYVPNGRKFGRNGGRPPKESTLIKRGLKAWIDDHANEEVPMIILDKATGKTVTIKKPRRVIAIEKLFDIAIKGDKVNGNATAISMWLDRYMGKPAQPIRGEGEDDPPFRLNVPNLSELIHKVYG